MVPVNRGQSDSAEKCNSEESYRRDNSEAGPTGIIIPEGNPQQTFGSAATWEPVPRSLPKYRSERQFQLVGSEFIALLHVSTYFLVRETLLSPLQLIMLPVLLKLTPGDTGKSKSTAVTIVEVQLHASSCIYYDFYTKPKQCGVTHYFFSTISSIEN